VQYRKQLLGVAVAAASLFAADQAALAKGKPDRVKERVTLEDTGTVAAAKARLTIERKGLAKQEVKLQVKASSGLELELFVETSPGSGELTLVGVLEERGRSGNYVLRIRTKKGDALPFGVADVAELSGLAVEVRTADGELVAGASLPEMAPTTVSAGNKRGNGKLVSRLAVDADATADLAAGDDAVEAKVKVRRKFGEESLEVELENAVSGLTVEAWIGDGTGGFSLAGAMTEKSSGDGSEYKLKIETERGDALPLGAASLTELAGRAVEVRLADGTVLASGTMPDLGDSGTDAHPGRGRGRGGDDSEDETEDDSGDDSGSDDSGSDD
jgi:hypothetical protein